MVIFFMTNTTLLLIINRMNLFTDIKSSALSEV